MKHSRFYESIIYKISSLLTKQSFYNIFNNMHRTYFTSLVREKGAGKMIPTYFQDGIAMNGND